MLHNYTDLVVADIRLELAEIERLTVWGGSCTRAMWEQLEEGSLSAPYVFVVDACSLAPNVDKHTVITSAGEPAFRECDAAAIPFELEIGLCVIADSDVEALSIARILQKRYSPGKVFTRDRQSSRTDLYAFPLRADSHEIRILENNTLPPKTGWLAIVACEPNPVIVPLFAEDIDFETVNTSNAKQAEVLRIIQWCSDKCREDTNRAPRFVELKEMLYEGLGVPESTDLAIPGSEQLRSDTALSFYRECLKGDSSLLIKDAIGQYISHFAERKDVCVHDPEDPFAGMGFDESDKRAGEPSLLGGLFRDALAAGIGSAIGTRGVRKEQKKQTQLLAEQTRLMAEQAKIAQEQNEREAREARRRQARMEAEYSRYISDMGTAAGIKKWKGRTPPPHPGY